MQLSEAAKVILLESAGHPDLMRLARFVYDEAAAGRQVPYRYLSELLEEASGKGVIGELRAHDPERLNDIVVAIGREIDRQAPIPMSRG